MPLHPARLWPWMATMKRIGLICAALLLICPITNGQSQQPSSKTVAVVNADPITRDALSQAALVRYGVDILDNMVNRHLILQACKTKGVEVTSEEVREDIRRKAANVDLSMEAYLQLLNDRRNMTPTEYSRMVWQMLALRKLVADDVTPTKEEFNQAYIARFGEAVKCRMIMVADKEKATQLHAQATADPSQFGSLAKRYSEDEASASVGGMIPPIRRHTSDTRLEDAVFALQNDQVSPVLQMGDQWIFMQAIRRIPASFPKAIAEPKIRERILEEIRDRKMPRAATKLFTQLQKEANVIKVLGDAKLEQQYPGVAAVVNGQQVAISAVAAECVKRHGADVLQGEINRKLLTQALRKANRQVTQADMQQEIVRAAESFGFVDGAGKADLAGWIDSVTSDGRTTQAIYESDSVWPSVALKKLVEDRVQITEEDLKRGFESLYGPRAEVLAIVLADQRTAQKVWEMARDNPTEEFFRQLAEQYSVEPVSAGNRGNVPAIRKYGGQPTIEQAAFKLQPGELSPILATGDKYILMRCQSFTKPIVQSIDAVKSELVRDIREKQLAVEMAKEFDRLKDSAEIDNFLELENKRPQVAAAQPTGNVQRR